MSARPAKKAKVVKPDAKAEEKMRARVAELNGQIEALLAEEEEKVEAIKEAGGAAVQADKDRVLEEALKTIPTLWGDALCYNDTLACIIADADKEVLKGLQKITVEVMDSLEFKLSMHFDDNTMFSDTVLYRVFGGETEEASGVKWKEGKSPVARNKAEHLKDDDPNSHYSLFELFDEGDLGEDELSVLFELRSIAEDPLAAYLGQDAEDSEDESSVEAVEFGDEDEDDE